MSDARPPRVMIDGFNLALPRGTGVSTYAQSLALAARGMGWGVEGLYGLKSPFNRKLREIVFFESLGNEHHTKRPFPLGLTWWRELSTVFKARKAREIALDGRVITQNFEYRLPEFDRLFTSPDMFDAAIRQFKRFGTFMTIRVPDPPEIMHWTYPFPVRLAGAKNIYTLHDLVPLRLPYASLDNKRHYRKLMQACIDRGDHICTVSEASAKDIELLFPSAKGKVSNTYQAVRVPTAVQELSEEQIAATVKRVFGLKPQGYFMFFGAIEPKKNVARLIEAFLASNIDTTLVLVGSRAWGADNELRMLQKDELQPLKTVFKNIRRIDYLPRSLLLQLVRGAKGVVFPSLYEGFGLPVLESMMLGTPVITSNTSSLPEVAGDAAMLVNPIKVPELVAAIRKIDKDAAFREQLSVAGRAQAEKFTMALYQDRLMDMYDRVLKGRSA